MPECHRSHPLIRFLFLSSVNLSITQIFISLFCMIGSSYLVLLLILFNLLQSWHVCYFASMSFLSLTTQSETSFVSLLLLLFLNFFFSSEIWPLFCYNGRFIFIFYFFLGWVCDPFLPKF